MTTGVDPGDVLLRVSDLEVSYGKITALRNLSFEVNQGEFVAIIGPNGAGKSTLCDAVSGYLDYNGSVQYIGQEVRQNHGGSAIRKLREVDSVGEWLTTLAGRSGSRGAKSMVADGLIHCSETRNLFGNMSVEGNLELGAYQRKGDLDSRREFVYDLFPILDERRDQLARTLSGGQQQMLAIGRALMGDPRMLILDEPTLGLAPVICDDIVEALEQIRTEGVTVLLLEQNVTFAMDLADRVFLLENGAFVDEGNPDELRDNDYIRDVYLGG